VSATTDGTDPGRVEWLVGGAVLLLFVMAVAAFGVFPTLAVIVVAGLVRIILRASSVTLLAILFLVGTGCDT